MIFCKITVNSNSVLKNKRFRHLETYHDTLNKVFQGYEGYGKRLFRQSVNIITQQWNFLLSAATAFFVRKKDLVN